MHIETFVMFSTRLGVASYSRILEALMTLHCDADCVANKMALKEEPILHLLFDLVDHSSIASCGNLALAHLVLALTGP